MKNTLKSNYNQSKLSLEIKTIEKELVQARNVINAEYQQMDDEDRIFITQTINRVIEYLSEKGGVYASC
jgi:hypothetical protein